MYYFFYCTLIKDLVSRVFGKWGTIKCSVIIYFFFILLKFVISWRDVTFGIRAMVFKRFLGSMGSELTVWFLWDHFVCCLLTNFWYKSYPKLFDVNSDMWRAQAMANRRKRNNAGADDIAQAIHRMMDAMQPIVALIKDLISRIFGKWGTIKCSVIIYFFFILLKFVISWRDVTMFM